MKKIISVASVGLLALAIFGCSKKTTKTTKKDDTTVTTKTNTSNTTTRGTTTKPTTTENKKEFKEVNYAAFKEKVDSIDDTKANYKKAIINGSSTNSPFEDDVTYDNYVYMLNKAGEFVASDGGKTSLAQYMNTKMLQYIPNDTNFKYYLNGNNEFAISQYTKLYIEGKCATICYTFNEYGYLTKIETKDIVDDNPTMDYTNTVNNFEIEWLTTDSFDGYNLISLEEAQTIASAYSEDTNKYIAAYITGTNTSYIANNVYTATNVALYYNNVIHGYTPYRNDVSIDIGYLNNLNIPSYDSVTDVFYYKNNNNEIAIVIYTYNSDKKLLVEKTIKFNDCGYAKSIKDVVVADKNPTYDYTLYDFEVEYLTSEPTITITLKSGIGTFSDGSEEMEVKAAIGKSINDLGSSINTPYLSGASLALSTSYYYKWFDENNEGINSNSPIYEDVTLTYGLMDSDYTSTPTLTYGINNTIGTRKKITFKVTYKEGENKGITFSLGSKVFYSCSDTITFDASGDETGGTIWGAFDGISFGDDKGLFSIDNNCLKTISCIRPINLIDYSFANLTNFEYFSQGSMGSDDFFIGDYAFYNCSSLESISINIKAPTSIGKYAFAKTNLCKESGIISGLLCDTPMVKEGAFSEIPNFRHIMRSIVLDYDEETNKYIVNALTFNYDNWEEGWCGDSENEYTVILNMDESKFKEGLSIVTRANDNKSRTFCALLNQSKKYNVNINMVSDYDTYASFRELDSSTSILNKIGTGTIGHENASFYSENNPAYFAFYVINRTETVGYEVTFTVKDVTA